MKKYKFSLEALLKIRMLRERKIKQEIGGIVSKIAENEDKIVSLQKKMVSCHVLQEESVKSGSTAKMLGFFPTAFHAYRREIEETKQVIALLKGNYREKVGELKSAMGDVKIIEKMKQQDLNLFTKKMDKKTQNDIEELLQHRGKA